MWDSQSGFPVIAHSSPSYHHHYDGEEEGRRRMFNDEAGNWAHVSCASREIHLTTWTMNTSITTGGGYARPVGWMRSSEEVQDVLNHADMSLGAAALVLLRMPEKKDKSYVCRSESLCPLGLGSVINLDNV